MLFRQLEQHIASSWAFSFDNVKPLRCRTSAKRASRLAIGELIWQKTWSEFESTAASSGKAAVLCSRGMLSETLRIEVQRQAALQQALDASFSKCLTATFSLSWNSFS